MELADEIAALRAGTGEPAAVVGELRRTSVLVPVLDGGLMSAAYGGIRWIYAFTGEASLARFRQGLAPRATAPDGPYDRVAMLGARLLDAVIPSLDGPTGIAVDVADQHASMLFPPVRGIVPDSCALDIESASDNQPLRSPR